MYGHSLLWVDHDYKLLADIPSRLLRITFIHVSRKLFFYLLHFCSKMLSFTYSGADVSTPVPSTERSGEANGSSHQTSPPKKNTQIQYPISNPACRSVDISEGNIRNPGLLKQRVWNQEEHPCISESANCKSTSQRSQNLLFPNEALREFRCFLFPISLYFGSSPRGFRTRVPVCCAWSIRRRWYNYGGLTV